jgi:ERCC4-type nuclease
VQWCLPVLRSTDAGGTAWLLAHMHAHRSQRLAPYHRYDYRRKGHISTVDERMLLQLQDVGPEIVKRLLERFRSVYGVLSASRDELLEVEGVGTFIAGQIERLRKGEK